MLVKETKKIAAPFETVARKAKISGTITSANSADKTILVFQRKTAELLGSTMADKETGYWEVFCAVRSDEDLMIICRDEGGDFNADIYDRVSLCTEESEHIENYDSLIYDGSEKHINERMEALVIENLAGYPYTVLEHNLAGNITKVASGNNSYTVTFLDSNDNEITVGSSGERSDIKAGVLVNDNLVLNGQKSETVSDISFGGKDLSLDPFGDGSMVGLFDFKELDSYSWKDRFDNYKIKHITKNQTSPYGLVGACWNSYSKKETCSYVDFPIDNTTEKTISFWYRPQGGYYSSYYGPIIYTAGYVFGLYSNTNGPLRIYTGNGSSWSYTTSENYMTPIHDWSMITITISQATGVRVYVNGVFVLENATPISAENAGGEGFNISDLSTGNYGMYFSMDLLSLFDRVLTDDEISELFESSKELKDGFDVTSIKAHILKDEKIKSLGVSGINLKARYPLDGHVRDIVGGNHGTIPEAAITLDVGGDFVGFDGSESLHANTQSSDDTANSLGDESTFEFYCVFTPNNVSSGSVQTIYKSGDSANGIGIAIDDSGNLILAGSSGSVITTIAVSGLESSKKYIVVAKQSVVAVYDETFTEIGRTEGVVTAGDGSGQETVGGSCSGSPITGTDGANIELFNGKVYEVGVYAGDLILDYLNDGRLACEIGETGEQCYVEVENWDIENNKIDLWVKVPEMTVDDDVVLRFYFNAEHDPNTKYVGQIGDEVGRKVWDDNFIAVYHMKKDGDVIKDSTSNRLHLSLVGGEAVGNTISFDGVDDYATSDNVTFDITENGFTYQATVKRSAQTGTLSSILSNGQTGANSDVILGIPANSDEIQFGTVSNFISGGNITDDTLQNLVAVYDGTNNATGLSLYSSGTLLTTAETGTFAGFSTTDDPFSIGANSVDGVFGNFLQATVDEVRISRGIRSDEWVDLDNKSLNDELVTYKLLKGSGTAPTVYYEERDWTPEQMTTELWLDATDDSSLVVEGGKVAEWNDKSGNDRNFIQTVDASRPEKVLNAVHFDGVNDILTSSSAFMRELSEVNIFLVGNFEPLSDRRIFGEANTGDDNPIYAIIQNSYGTPSQIASYIRVTSSNGLVSTGDLINNTDVFDDTNCLIHVHDARSTLIANVNAVDGVTHNYVDATINTNVVFLGGLQRISADYFAKGQVKELIVTGALTDEERRKLEGYLMHKWNLEQEIPSEHPYETKQPVYQVEINGSYERLWVPNDIEVDFWIDPFDLSSIVSDYNKVSYIKDKSGNNRHAIQDVAVDCPEYVNDTSLLSFGLNDHLKVPNTFTRGHDLSLFLVASSTRTDTSRIFDSKGGTATSSNDGGFQFLTSGASSTGCSFTIADGSSYDRVNTGTDNIFRASGNLTIVGLFYDSQTGIQRVTMNGTEVVSNSAGTDELSLSATIENMLIGAGYADTNGFVGLMGDVVYFDSVLGIEDIAKVEGCLAHKWDLADKLPSDHEYKTAPPKVLVEVVTDPNAQPTERSWTPEDENYLELWYDASDSSSVLVDSNGIYKVKDKSGNGIHLSQTSDAAKPQLIEGSLNGLSTINFDSDDLLTSDPFRHNTTNAQGLTHIFLMKRDSCPTAYPVFISKGTVNTEWSFVEYSSTNQTVFRNIIGGDIFIDQPQDYFIVVARTQTNNQHLRITGTDAGTGNYATALEIYDTGLYFNNSSAGTNGGDFTLCEFITLNRYASDSDVQKFEGYLAHKWGIQANLPAIHTYALNAPKVLIETERSWIPKDVSKIYAWYDASDSERRTVETGVALLKDKSGNGFEAVQTTTTKQPIIVPGLLNGKDVFSFDGGDSLKALITDTIKPATFFVVVRSTNASNRQYIFDGGGSNSLRNLLAYVGGNDGTIESWSSTWYQPGISASTEFEIFEAVYNSPESIIGVNGIRSAGGSSGDYPLGDSLRIGRNYEDSQDGLYGEIAELILFDGLLTDDERQKVEGYLAHKWGLDEKLASDHVYKSTQPSVVIETIPDNSNEEDWTPESIDVDLWLDADDQTTITSDVNGLSEWVDKSGNNNNAVQTDDTYKPLINSGSINDKTTISFNGSGDHLDILDSNTMDTDNNVSVFCVIVNKAISNRSFIFSSSVNDTANGFWLETGTRSGDYSSGFATGIPGMFTTKTSGVLSVDQPVLLSYTRNGTGDTHEVYTEGSLRSHSYGAGEYVANSSDKVLGVRIKSTRTYPFNGDIAELIIVQKTVDTETRQKIEGYLAHKWGLQENLSITHPYKDKQPVIITTTPETPTPETPTVATSITAKTVIFDVKDNYGRSYTGMRSIEFYKDGVRIDLTESDFTAYATTNFNDDYLPKFTFDTSISKSGTFLGRQWLSLANTPTDQRLAIVLNTAIEFDTVVINNSHDSGLSSETTSGVKGITIYSSTDALTDTTYGAEVVNGTKLYEGIIPEHRAVDSHDNFQIELFQNLQTLTTKSIIVDIGNNQGGLNSAIRAIKFLNKYGGVMSMENNTDFTAYATSVYSGYDKFDKWRAFDTSLSDTGTQEYNEWIFAGSQVHRLVCVFTDEQEISGIQFHNRHHEGVNTDQGVKNVVIHASTDAITDTTPYAPISNKTLLYADIMPQHVISDRPDYTLIPFSDFLNVDGITSKSVILDIANNWGGATTGVRRVEFYRNGKLIQLTASDFTADANNVASSQFAAAFAFDTSLSKTGSELDTTWSATNTTGNLRLLVNFNEAIEFDTILITNASDTGGSETDHGIKDVVITSSTDDITDTTFEAAITNGTVIFNGEVPKRDAVDIQTHFPIRAFVKTVTSKTTVIDIRDNWGHTNINVRSIEFVKDGVVIPMESGFTAYATTQWDASYSPDKLFLTNLTKLGTHASVSWNSSTNVVDRQRIVIVFDTPIEYDSIVINNGRTSSNVVTCGAKNISIYSSEDEFTGIEYGIPVPNSTKLFEGKIEKHTAVDEEDDYIIPIYIASPSVTEPEQTLIDWTPEHTTTNLWLDAADNNTITIDTGVSEWKDKSGNNRHLTQSDINAQPLYTDNQHVYFDGVDDGLSVLDNLDMAGNPDILIIAVVRPLSNNSTAGRIFEIGDSSNGVLALSAGSDGWGWRYNNGNEIYNEVDTDSFQLIAFVRSSGTEYQQAQLFLNGIEASHTTQTNPTYTPNVVAELTTLGYGNAASSQDYLDMFMSEIMIVDTNSYEERQKIEGYLAHKWGLESKLPNDHPYKDKQPQISLDASEDSFDIELDQSAASGKVTDVPIVIHLDGTNELHAPLFSDSGTMIKSLVLDIKRNWREEHYIGIRSVEFFDMNGDLIPLSTSDFTANATGWANSSASYHPNLAFDTSLPKTGGEAGNNWLSDYVFVNQRLFVVLNNAVEVSRIEINNYHQGTGSYLDLGAKETVITVTDQVVSDTNYQGVIDNGTVIFDGTLRQHIADNAADPQPFSTIADVRNTFKLTQFGSPVPVEIDYWDSLAKKAIIYAKVPDSTKKLNLDYTSDNPVNSNIGVAGSDAAKDVWSLFSMAFTMTAGSNFDCIDSSGNIASSTVYGNMSDSDITEYGYALSFDGIDDYVVLPNSAATSDWTFFALVSPIGTQDSGDGIITSDGDGLVFAGGQNCSMSNNNVERAGSSTEDGFIFLAGTSDGKFYENGVEVSIAYSNSNWALDGVTRIGIGYAGRKAKMQLAFAGKMDTVASADMINLMYKSFENSLLTFSKKEPEEEGLSTHLNPLETWEEHVAVVATISKDDITANQQNFPVRIAMSDSSGKTNEDLSIAIQAYVKNRVPKGSLLAQYLFGSDNDGMAGFSTDGVSYVANHLQKKGAALEFDGSGSNTVTLPSSTRYIIGAKLTTISMWIKPSLYEGTYRGVIGTRYVNEFEFRIDYGYRRFWMAYGNGSKYHSLGSPTNTIGYKERWYHVVYVRDVDSGMHYMYVDGKLVASGGCSYVPSINSSYSVTIGDDANYSPFKGALSDVQFHSRAFSEDEVELLYLTQLSDRHEDFVVNVIKAENTEFPMLLGSTFDSVNIDYSVDPIKAQEVSTACTIDDKTYKIYSNDAWVSIASNDDAVHGVTGDFSWYYTNGTDWFKSKFDTPNDALSRAMNYSDNQMSINGLNLLASDKLSTLFNPLTGLFNIAVAFKEDNDSYTGVEISNVVINNKRFWMSDVFDLEEFTDIVGSKVNWSWNASSEKYFKVYVIKTGDANWTECTTNGGDIPVITSGMPTNGVHIQFKVEYDLSINANPEPIALDVQVY